MSKNYKEYDIKRPGFTDGIKVRIYKTPESMRRGYLAEYARFNKCKNTEDISDLVGMFYSPCYMASDLIAGRFTNEMYGIMFLNEKFITPEVVIHECVHCEYAHEKDIVRFNMDYSGDTHEHEERFAYHLGWLSAELLHLLKKEGYLR